MASGESQLTYCIAIFAVSCAWRFCSRCLICPAFKFRTVVATGSGFADFRPLFCSRGLVVTCFLEDAVLGLLFSECLFLYVVVFARRDLLIAGLWIEVFEYCYFQASRFLGHCVVSQIFSVEVFWSMFCVLWFLPIAVFTCYDYLFLCVCVTGFSSWLLSVAAWIIPVLYYDFVLTVFYVALFSFASFLAAFYFFVVFSLLFCCSF